MRYKRGKITKKQRIERVKNFVSFNAKETSAIELKKGNNILDKICSDFYILWVVKEDYTENVPLNLVQKYKLTLATGILQALKDGKEKTVSYKSDDVVTVFNMGDLIKRYGAPE